MKQSRSDRNKIERLQQGVADNRARRHAALAQTKLYQERLREIAEAPERKLNSFWCNICAIDFDQLSVKRVAHPTGSYPRAWYESKCPQQHSVVLHITDKHQDPYYVQSKALQEMRYAMRDELLHPSDPRFRYVYPTQWRKLKEEEEMKRAAEEQQMMLT